MCCGGLEKRPRHSTALCRCYRSGHCWQTARCAVGGWGGDDSAERGATEAPHGARWRAPSCPTAPSGGQALACYAARGLIHRRIRADARLRCDVASPRRLVACEGDQAQRFTRQITGVTKNHPVSERILLIGIRTVLTSISTIARGGLN